VLGESVVLNVRDELPPRAKPAVVASFVASGWLAF